MTDRSLIFSPPMIRALLDGRKTMTRRLLKPQPERNVDGWDWGWTPPGYPKRHLERFCWRDDSRPLSGINRFLPYRRGDRVWVRETWQAGRPALPSGAGLHPLVAGKPTADMKVVYRADGDDFVPPLKWRSPIHMPRRFSRLTLVLTDVKIERLQEISEEDAIAEGIYKSEPTEEDLEWYADWAPEHGIDPAKEPMEGVWMAPGTRQGWGLTKAARNREQWGPTAEFAFRLVWESIHGADAWNRNPWVVALRFDVYKLNIDEMEQAA